MQKKVEIFQLLDPNILIYMLELLAQRRWKVALDQIFD